MTELKNSNSAFATALKEVFSQGEKQEALSAKVLFAMIDMEATFSIEWLEGFYRAESKVRTTIIENALNELSPDFAAIVESADMSVKDIRKETNPSKKQRLELEKQSAQQKRKAAQNMIRNVALALVLFRVGVPNEKKEGEYLPIDKWSLTERKRVRFSVKGEGWHNATGYTFKDLIDMGQALAAQKNWIVVKKSEGTTKVGSGSSGAANEGKSLVDDAKAMNLKSVIETLTSVLKSKDFAKLSDEESEAIRNLEEAIIVRTYGDSKGNVDIDMLSSMYVDVKSKKNAA